MPQKLYQDIQNQIPVFEKIVIFDVFEIKILFQFFFVLNENLLLMSNYPVFKKAPKLRRSYQIAIITL